MNQKSIFLVLALVIGYFLPNQTFAQSTPGRFTHHVLIWLNNPESETDRRRLIEGVEKLRQVPSVKHLSISLPAPVAKRPVVDNTFSLSCLFYFENISGHDAYQIHPLHKEFVEKCSSLWKKVVVYDAEEL